jgi:hypothetical protein
MDFSVTTKGGDYHMSEPAMNPLTRQVVVSLPSEVTQLQNEPHKVGFIDEPGTRVIRIVHISDTHGLHNNFKIPDGDILIHSGDFFDWNDAREFKDQIALLDQFFAMQPHKHKVSAVVWIL